MVIKSIARWPKYIIKSLLNFCSFREMHSLLKNVILLWKKNVLEKYIFWASDYGKDTLASPAVNVVNT